MKKRDIILIFAILAAAAVSFIMIPRTSADIANITVAGKHFCTVSLHENREIDINGTNVAVVENGQIYMKSATCPDKLCIHQGAICDSSKKIVCLPNKVVIEAAADSDIDTVVR